MIKKLRRIDNYSGFTLIELLAVVIILAIIALIAVPIILEVVEESRNSANMSSAQLIVSSGHNYYAASLLDEEKQAKIENGINLFPEIEMSNKPENGQLYVSEDNNVAMAVVIDNKCYKKTYYSEIEVVDVNDCDLGYMGPDDVNPNVSQKVVNTSINENGWYKEDMYVEIEVTDNESGPAGYRRCMGQSECEPTDEVYGVDNKILINTESEKNYICVIGIDNKGNKSEKNCVTYKLDKTSPTLIAKNDNIDINEKDSNVVSNYFTVSYGISGGSMNCNPTNTNTLSSGKKNVSCTATSGSGLSTTVSKEIVVKYVETSGANKPELLTNMIPVRYDGSNWIYAASYEKWYDYNSKEWANAVVLKKGVSKTVGQTISESEIALWYVWIPRYKYQLFNVSNGTISEKEIQIQFESGTATTGTVKCTTTATGSGSVSETCTNAFNGNWYTHPAFTLGSKSLTGFWVGKFEVSGSPSEITIKPNVTSLRNQSVYSFYNSIQNINNIYGLNGDSHMMKNMEWGAVAYLSHSKYGTCTNGTCSQIGINNNSNYTTGCGIPNGNSQSTVCYAYSTPIGVYASTTGNIYGIYDMSGGATEYVMGNMVNSSGAFYTSSSGFTSAPNSKYYDSYSYNTDYRTFPKGKLGDATRETIRTSGTGGDAWYGNLSFFLYSNRVWFGRGGTYEGGTTTTSGLFMFTSKNGSSDEYYSSRAVVCTP